jgi:hypothetical protein
MTATPVKEMLAPCGGCATPIKIRVAEHGVFETDSGGLENRAQPVPYMPPRD